MASEQACAPQRPGRSSSALLQLIASPWRGDGPPEVYGATTPEDYIQRPASAPVLQTGCHKHHMERRRLLAVRPPALPPPRRAPHHHAQDPAPTCPSWVFSFLTWTPLFSLLSNRLYYFPRAPICPSANSRVLPSRLPEPTHCSSSTAHVGGSCIHPHYPSTPFTLSSHHPAARPSSPEPPTASPTMLHHVPLHPFPSSLTIPLIIPTPL